MNNKLMDTSKNIQNTPLTLSMSKGDIFMVRPATEAAAGRQAHHDREVLRGALTLLAILAICILVSSCSKSPAVATVNGETITASALRAQMHMERGKYDSAFLSGKANLEAFRKRAMDTLIEKAILLSEAKRLGLTVSKDEINEIEKMRAGALPAEEGDASIKDRGIDPKFWVKTQKDKLLIGKLINREVIEKIPVSDEQISAYYKKNSQAFNQPATFHARQILVGNKDEAESILAKLKEGGDFAELAKEFSLSPDGKRGGDIGFFDSHTYPEIFSEVCQQLQIGETSGVVQTDYGFQIFEVLEKRPAREVPYEEAKEKIRQTLREEKAEGNVEKWLADLKKKANVAVNEEAVKGVGLD